MPRILSRGPLQTLPTTLSSPSSHCRREVVDADEFRLGSIALFALLDVPNARIGLPVEAQDTLSIGGDLGGRVAIGIWSATGLRNGSRIFNRVKSSHTNVCLGSSATSRGPISSIGPYPGPCFVRELWRQAILRRLFLAGSVRLDSRPTAAVRRGRLVRLVLDSGQAPLSPAGASWSALKLMGDH